MQPIPLVGSAYSAFSLAAAAQTSLNCYLESIEAAEGKSKVVLRGRPGMRLFQDASAIVGAATPIRGIWAGGGRLFIAAGTKFFEMNSAGALVGLVGNIADDSIHSPVDILANGNQLFVVSAGLSYCDNGFGLVQNVLPTLSGQCSTLGTLVLWEDSAATGGSGSTVGNKDTFDVGMVGQSITINGVSRTVSKITNPKLLQLTSSAGFNSFKDWSSTPVMNAIRGTFMDGYFIINRPQSRQFNISALLDGSTWGGLDFAVKEGYPDNIMAVWAEPPLLYLLGTETLEVWRNTGNPDFPLERVDGGFARVGLASTWSPCSIMGKLHMLAGGTYGQTVAVRMEGATPVRISTYAVEESIATAGILASQAVSYSYLDRGHWFWVVNFAGSAFSWVYDATESAKLGTPQWHKRAEWNNGAQQFTPYRPWVHAFIPEWGPNGKHIVGDYSSGKLFELNSGFGDDDGADIRGQRAIAHLWNDGNRMSISRLELEMELGMGVGPTVWLDWSDDRGQTFVPNPARTLTVGLAGFFARRAFVNRLGSPRDRVFRLTWQGQTRIALIALNAEIDPGVA